MTALRVNDVLDTTCSRAAAAADADTRCVEHFFDEAGGRDGALAAEDVEDGGPEMGEADGGVVLFGAVDGSRDGGVWVKVVIWDEGGVGDEISRGVEGGPEGADKGEDFLVSGCGETDGGWILAFALIVL